MPNNGHLKVSFTYGVHWEESEIAWASRWDAYVAAVKGVMTANPEPA